MTTASTDATRAGRPGQVIVVMGVAGSGKSTVGAALAARLGWTFCEGDGFHPPGNVAKMASGVPLDEEDRGPWLAALRARIAAAIAAGEDLVVACSALKESHRDVLRVDPAHVRFVALEGDPALIAARLRARTGHFMKAALLPSQLAALEEAPDALVLDIAAPPEALVAAIVSALEVQAPGVTPRR